MSWFIEEMLSAITGLLAGLLNLFQIDFTKVANFDLTTFREFFPTFDQLASVFQAVGYLILILIVVFQLMRIISSPFSERTDSIVPLIFRAGICLILLFTSVQVFDWLFALAKAPIDALNPMLDQITSSAFLQEKLTFTNPILDAAQKIEEDGALSFSWDVLSGISFGGLQLLIALIAIIVLGWNYVKVIFECVERYVILCMMAITSPLVIPTAASSSTLDIFKSWLRMLFSTMLLIFLYNIMIAVINYALGTMFDHNAGIIFPIIIVLSMLRLTLQLDSIMARIGLSTAQTAGGVGMDLIIGMGMMQRGISNVGRGASKFGGFATPSYNGKNGSPMPTPFNNSLNGSSPDRKTANSINNLNKDLNSGNIKAAVGALKNANTVAANDALANGLTTARNAGALAMLNSAMLDKEGMNSLNSIFKDDPELATDYANQAFAGTKEAMETAGFTMEDMSNVQIDPETGRLQATVSSSDGFETVLGIGSDPIDGSVQFENDNGIGYITASGDSAASFMDALAPRELNDFREAIDSEIEKAYPANALRNIGGEDTYDRLPGVYDLVGSNINVNGFEGDLYAVRESSYDKQQLTGLGTPIGRYSVKDAQDQFLVYQAKEAIETKYKNGKEYLSFVKPEKTEPSGYASSGPNSASEKRKRNNK